MLRVRASTADTHSFQVDEWVYVVCCVCSTGQEGVRPRVGLAEVPRGGASVGVALDAAEGRSGALPRRARLPAHQVLLVLSGLTSGFGGGSGGSGGDSGSGSRCGGFGSVGPANPIVRRFPI